VIIETKPMSWDIVFVGFVTLTILKSKRNQTLEILYTLNAKTKREEN
jgi:hypothetical protein